MGEKLGGLGEIGLGDPIGSIGVLVDYVCGRIQREVRPERISHGPCGALQARRRGLRAGLGAAWGDRGAAARAHRQEIVERQFQQKRLSDAISDIYAQVAVLSRVSQIFADQGVEPSGQERYIADTFCTRAASPGALQPSHQIESNDDERMSAIAKLAYKRGEYGYALFED